MNELTFISLRMNSLLIFICYNRNISQKKKTDSYIMKYEIFTSEIMFKNISLNRNFNLDAH